MSSLLGVSIFLCAFSLSVGWTSDPWTALFARSFVQYPYLIPYPHHPPLNRGEIGTHETLNYHVDHFPVDMSAWPQPSFPQERKTSPARPKLISWNGFASQVPTARNRMPDNATDVEVIKSFGDLLGLDRPIEGNQFGGRPYGGRPLGVKPYGGVGGRPYAGNGGGRPNNRPDNGENIFWNHNNVYSGDDWDYLELSNTCTNSFTGTSSFNSLNGICAPPEFCSRVGGRPSTYDASNCGRRGTSCCINTVNTCNGRVTVNNTYWQPPADLTGRTTCGVTVRLDNDLVEQDRPICQVRLDFLTFSISQPNIETVCATDTFTVTGTNNYVPVICGDNPDQHMYLDVPQWKSDIDLRFSFGAAAFTRTWNIQISQIPCGSSNLAPKDCLQYFRSASGTVRSFNWIDVANNGASRQLADQDYKLCFRTELVPTSNQWRTASSICMTECALAKNAKTFSLSWPSGLSQRWPNVEDGGSLCNNDFLIINNAFNTVATPWEQENVEDRFCGERFNVGSADGYSNIQNTICSNFKPFFWHYKTNGDESQTDNTDVGTANGVLTYVGNIGFCLDFQQRNL